MDHVLGAKTQKLLDVLQHMMAKMKEVVTFQKHYITLFFFKKRAINRV